MLPLLGRLGALPREPSAQRRYLIEGLAALVEADCWIWALQSLESESVAAAYYAVVAGGFDGEEQKVRCLLSAFAPELQAILWPIASRLAEHCTFTRSELIADGDWYASPFYTKHRAPAGLDDFLFSFYPVGPGVQSAIRLHRRRGRAPFGRPERRIVHALSGAIDWLHRAEVGEEPLPSLQGLGRREREVLLLLLEGHGKKQIGAELGISEHTVGDYVKALHRHFRVHSRGELLARFIPHSLLTGESD